MWLVTATLAQGASLWLRAGELPHAVAATAIVAVAIALLRCLRRFGAGSWAEVAAFTGAVGGLGMAAGWHLDQLRLANVTEWCSPAAGTGMTNGTIGWSQGLMFAGCMGSMALAARVEPIARNAAVLGLKAAGCLGGMWLGMIGGGHLLPRAFAKIVGDGAAMHVAMVIGMTIGAAVTHAALWSPRTTHEPENPTSPIASAQRLRRGNPVAPHS